jgi:hypothetical protein
MRIERPIMIARNKNFEWDIKLRIPLGKVLHLIIVSGRSGKVPSMNNQVPGRNVGNFYMLSMSI